MESAFGIDHGDEVSKTRLPRRLVGGKPLGPRAPSRASQIKGKLNRIGEADVSLKGIGEAAGRVTRGAGNFMINRPGLTGTALVGGGGAAGYKALSEKQPKRKRS